uniref:Uncharacterized protein n=1 Tax=Podarcis muralis TaxID=64176 RepID=A0A670IBJ8_PODMU
MLSNESLRPPVYSRSNSQASVDSTSMEDFWCEVENIKENTEDRQDEQTLLDVKAPDGVYRHFKYILTYACLTLCWQNVTLPPLQICFREAGECPKWHAGGGEE